MYTSPHDGPACLWLCWSYLVRLKPNVAACDACYTAREGIIVTGV